MDPAPYDLAAIKRIRDGGFAIGAAPIRVGNLDVLSPIASQLAALGGTESRAGPRNVPGGLGGPTEEKSFQINTESAYSTNNNEEALLLDPGCRQKIAARIARGIANYVSFYGGPAASGRTSPQKIFP